MSRTDFFRKMLSDTETTARITTRADVLRELFQEFDAEIAALKARVEELERHVRETDALLEARRLYCEKLESEAEVLKSLITAMGGTALQIESFKTSSYITNVAGEQHE